MRNFLLAAAFGFGALIAITPAHSQSMTVVSDCSVVQLTPGHVIPYYVNTSYVPCPASPAVAGGATSAKQDTGNTSLATIATNTTGAATAAKQDTGNTSLATIATNSASLATAAKQDIGNTSLSAIATASASQATAANQTTTNSSLSTIATASGTQATAANQTTMNSSIIETHANAGSDASKAGAVQGITGGKPLNVSPDNVVDGQTVTGSASSATTLLTASTTGGSGYFVVTVVTSGSTGNKIQADAAPDGTTYINGIGTWLRLDTTAAPGNDTGNTLSSGNVYIVPVIAQTMRFRVSVYSIGTPAISVLYKRGPVPIPPIQGQVAGAAASGGTPGNPILGGAVYTAAGASAADTKLINNQAAINGALLIRPFATGSNEWNYAAAAGGISNTATAVTIKAADATRKNCITDMQIQAGALGAATEIAIRDGAGGTVVWRGTLSTAGIGADNIHIASPVCNAAANTLLEVVTLTATITGSVYFNAQGFLTP